MLSLPKEVLKRVDKIILKLTNEPRPRGCVKLKGYDLYRVRVGNYRVLYRIDDDILIDAGSSVGDLSLDELKKIKHIYPTHTYMDHFMFLPLMVDSIFSSKNGRANV